MSEPVVAPACSTCLRELKPGATFCGGCGAPIAPRTPARSDIRTLITFYVTSLVIAAISLAYVRITGNELAALIGASLALAILSLGYALANRDLIREPARTPGFALTGYALILLASVPIVALVAGYVELLHALVGIRVPGELEIFDGSPVWLAVVLIVILPPLSEELAFRGLIFGGLRRTLSVTDAFLISSFAFAMLHLSIPSLVTHFPLGLYLCWLRSRSGSLWPGVFAHACHNLGICILAWCTTAA